MNNLSSKLIIVFDGIGHKDGYRDFKKLEEEKRKEGQDKMLMKVVDPLHKSSYGSVMEIAKDYTKFIDSDITCESEKKFIKACVENNVDLNLKYLANVLLLNSPGFSLKIIKDAIIKMKILDIDIVDSGDDEADWVIVREARKHAPSLIITSDTDIAAFAGCIDNVFLLSPLEKTEDPIYLKASWDNATNAMKQMPSIYVKILMLMYGCDFTAHKGAYMSCTMENLEKIMHAGSRSMALLRNIAPRSSIGKTTVGCVSRNNIYEYLKDYHGDKAEAVDAIVDHAFHVIFSD